MSDELKPHPFAELFPMLGDDELREMADDIEEKGQDLPVIIDQHNRIVDGRNRNVACKLKGIPVKVEQRHFANDREVLRFIISLNLRRRHLTESQRAMIAAEIANMERGRPTSQVNSANLPNYDTPPVSQAEAADMLHVSTRSVTSAAKVKNGTPELQQAVIDGVMPVSAAAAVADKPEEEQRAAVEKRKAKKSGGGGNGRAKPSGNGRAKKDEPRFAGPLRWAVRRKRFTLAEMADQTGYNAESCRRELSGAIACTGYMIERLDENEYRVRRAVHFVPVDAIPEGETVGLMEVLRDLYNDAVRARNFEADFGSSTEWTRQERGEFLNKFISVVRQIIEV